MECLFGITLCSLIVNAIQYYGNKATIEENLENKKVIDNLLNEVKVWETTVDNLKLTIKKNSK